MCCESCTRAKITEHGRSDQRERSPEKDMTNLHNILRTRAGGELGDEVSITKLESIDLSTHCTQPTSSMNMNHITSLVTWVP
jgi:hypothetical protein